MKKRLYSIIIYCFLVFFACTSQEKSIPVSTIRFDTIQKVTYREIKIPDFIIGYPQSLNLVEEFLVLEDFFQRENGLYIINRNTGQLHAQGMKKGRGPGEVINPDFNVMINKDQKEISVFEANLKKTVYYYYQTKDSLKLAREENLPLHLFKQENVFDCLSVDQYHIGTGVNGLFDSLRFAVFNKNTLKPFGSYPNLKDYLLPEVKARDVIHYVFFMKTRPDKKKLVTASYIGALLEIFDISQLPDMKQDTAILIYPPTKIKGSVDDFKNRIIGFEDIYATDKYIYTLLSGCTSEDESYIFPQAISVFDWKGNPVKQYKTNIGLKSIAVDEETKKIYAIAYTKEDIFTLIEISINQ